MPASFRPVLSWLALLAVSTLSGGTMVATAAYLYLAPLLPEAEAYRYVQLETPLRVYTSDGRLIDEIGNRRDPINYEDIPKHLIDALIATEDVRFYSPRGRSPEPDARILRIYNRSGSRRRQHYYDAAGE